MEVPTLKELETTVKSTAKKAAVETKEIKIAQYKSKKSLPNGAGYGTGRRKSSVARVWVKPGKGVITVNSKDFDQYFPRDAYRSAIMRVFADTNTTGQFDITCTVKGGGTTGQAGAIVHGVARALDCISEDYHVALHKNGHLTRDSREVERKKYGRRKARRKKQFSKR
jgi:small subunit ribosomal protein S9